MNSKSLVIVSFLIVFMVVKAMKKPRGIRNNNPGNIRHNDDWQGMTEVQTDKDFVQFIAPEWGIRAMYRILMNYRNRYGLKTIPQIIDRWAPPTENETGAYILSVAKKLGVNPQYLDLQALDISQYPALIEAIIFHENGQQPYSPETIAKGIALA